MPRFESRAGRFFEIEGADCSLTQLEGAIDGATDGSKIGSPSTRVFSTADEARYAAARLIARRCRRAGYQLVGDARCLDGVGREAPPPASTIALEAYFAAADPQFLPELLRATGPSHVAGLAALAERWYRDD